MEKTYYLIERFCRATHLPLRLFSPDGQIELFSFGYTSEQDPLHLDPAAKSTLLQGGASPKMPRLEFELDVVCTAVFLDTIGHIFVLGPVCLYPENQDVSRKYAAAHNIAPDFLLPVSDLDSFSAAITLLFFQLTGYMVTETELALFRPASISESPAEDNRVQAYIMERTEQEQRHFTYEEEVSKMQPIVDGDVDAVRRAFTPEALRTAQELTGQMANTPLKQWEYMVVSSTTLAMRAAIQGGLAPATAYSVSDTLLQKLSQRTDLPGIIQLQQEVLLTFAACVRDAKLQHSRLSCVEDAKSYINEHLNKPYDLEQLAAYVGVNKSYLCRRFKQREGMTMTQYAQRQRIHAAKNMLRFSRQSISSIAAYLCFHSQSHFGRIFRQFTGMSPGEYRKMQ